MQHLLLLKNGESIAKFVPSETAIMVIADGKKLVKESVDRKPEARREKIISFSKQKKEFTLQDILNLLPDVPRRTVQRDLEVFHQPVLALK